jgi:predicted amidohydrolase YtcJ
MHPWTFGRRAVAVVLAVLLLGACDRSAEPPIPAAASPEPAGADHAFLNGYIYTADQDHTIAEAVAVRGSRILHVGSNADVRAFIDRRTEVHDLDGRMLMPGLHDVHIHLLGLAAVDGCDLESRPLSLADLSAFVASCLETYPLQDGWLIVDQWSFAIGNQPDERLPTVRAALDAASRDVPVFLRGNDGHHAAVNSTALAQAVAADGRRVGLTGKTLATHFPAYRRYIGLDAQGEPDGTLSESARLLVNPPDLWGFSTFDDGRMREVVLILARSGLTTVQDAALEPETLPLFERYAGAHGMTFRLHAALFPDLRRHLDRHGRVSVESVLGELRASRERYREHPQISAEAAKIFIDGVLEGNPLADPPTLPNAAVLQPYLQPVFSVDPGSGMAELTGYVDTVSPVCVAVRAEWERYADSGEAARFRRQHGFHPSRCEISRGMLEHSEDFIREYMRALLADGFTIHAHAIGDRAVRVAVVNFTDLAADFGPLVLPHTIAHAQLVHPVEQQRIGQLGLFVAFTYAWMEPNPEYDLTVNPFISRIGGNATLYNPGSYVMRNLYPVRNILHAGGVLAAGSDAPVDTRDPRPFVNIARAITRANADGVALNAAQTIGIHDAIAAYTRNGARAVRTADRTGTIEKGKQADLILLDRNLVELAGAGRAALIEQTRVLLTMFDGRIVFRAD